MRLSVGFIKSLKYGGRLKMAIAGKVSKLRRHVVFWISNGVLVFEVLVFEVLGRIS